MVIHPVSGPARRLFPERHRQGNRPLFCRVTAPAKKSRLRMAVSMLLHRVFLRVFAYERVDRSIHCWRWKPMTRRRTWWCGDRSLAKCCALRVHVTYPYSCIKARRHACSSHSSCLLALSRSDLRVLDLLLVRVDRALLCCAVLRLRSKESKGSQEDSPTNNIIVGNYRLRSGRICLLYTSPSPRD